MTSSADSTVQELRGSCSSAASAGLHLPDATSCLPHSPPPPANASSSGEQESQVGHISETLWFVIIVIQSLEGSLFQAIGETSQSEISPTQTTF